MSAAVETDVSVQLWRMHAALRGACDGANTKDGHGYAKPDVAFGHGLAVSNPAEWTPAETWIAWAVARKYKVQLRELFGLDFDALEEPERPGLDKSVRRLRESFRLRAPGAVAKAAPVVAEVLASEQQISVKFSRRPSPESLAVVRAIPAKYDGIRWRGPSTASSAKWVLDLLETEGLEFDCSPEVHLKLVELSQRAEAPVFRGFTVSREGERFLLTSPEYPGAKAVEVAKGLPGSKAKVSGGKFVGWYAGILAAGRLVTVVEAMPALFRWQSPEVAQAAQEAIQQVSVAEEGSRATAGTIEVQGVREGLQPYPFQLAGIEYARKSKRCFIADEMGLGKTIQAVLTVHSERAYPAVVVAPASTLLNWQREIEKWLPELEGKVQILRGLRPKASDVGYALVYVLNYEVVRAWAAPLSKLEIQALVIDESHRAKSSKAQRTKALMALSRGVRIRLCLSGTPIVNAPIELVTQLKILDRLDDLGGWQKYVNNYCVEGPFGLTRGGRNLSLLNSQLRQVCMVRRLKQEVLAELPEKRWFTVSIEQTAKDREAIRMVEREVAQWVDDHPEASTAEAVVMISKLRQEVARLRMDRCVEWIHDQVEGGEKVIVFAHHREIVLRAAEALGCKTISGGDSQADRQAAIDAFQTDPDVRAIVCSISAAGVGITLTAASNVVFLEQGWTPADMDQAIDRAHRIGQRESVSGWLMIMEDSIDQWMADLVEEKRSVVDVATDGFNRESGAVSKILRLISDRAKQVSPP